MAGGAQLRAFPQPVLEDCQGSERNLCGTLADQAQQENVDSVVPYRSNAYAWLQVAEFGFDSFRSGCARAPDIDLR